jgi:glyoxylase I family protein
VGQGTTLAPQVASINHVGLTVKDIDLSKRWYSELFGFTIASELAQDGYKLAILERDGSPFSIGLFEFDETPGDTFDAHRPGMNHLAFTVPTRDGLEEWLSRFGQMKVENSGIHESINGWVLTFRDPDNIALEVYTEYGVAGRSSH